jgi:hypothetical protein
MDNDNFTNNQNQNLISEENQFPSQEEIINNNNYQENQTSNYIPPIDNKNNQDIQPSNYIPPIDNKNNQDIQPSNYIPPIYNNNNNNYIPPEVSLPPPNPPISYPKAPAQPQQPRTIYQQLNIPNPLNQNLSGQDNPNTYTNSTNNNIPSPSNIYDYQSMIPPNIPNIPIPESVEEKHIPLEVQQNINVGIAPPIPLETYQPVNNNTNIKSQNIYQEKSCCEDCGECCESCCQCFGDCLTCQCCDEECCNNCAEFAECLIGVCQILLICLSCLEMFR